MKTCIVILCLAVSFAAGATIVRNDLVKDDLPPPPEQPCGGICGWSGVNLFPHFTSCERYYQCIHGFFFEITCAFGQSFDHRTLRCLPNSEARCIFEGPVDIAPVVV